MCGPRTRQVCGLWAVPIRMAQEMKSVNMVGQSGIRAQFPESSLDFNLDFA